MCVAEIYRKTTNELQRNSNMHIFSLLMQLLLSYTMACLDATGNVGSIPQIPFGVNTSWPAWMLLPMLGPYHRLFGVNTSWPAWMLLTMLGQYHRFFGVHISWPAWMLLTMNGAYLIITLFKYEIRYNGLHKYENRKSL